MNRYSTVLLALLAITLSACSDHKEINDVAPVLAIGIDKVNEKIQVTVVIPIPQSVRDTRSSGNKPYYLDSDIGRNMEEAIQNIQNRTSRIFRFSHQRVILIHENIAKNDIKEVLDFVNRNQESRLSSQIYITKSNVLDIMNARSELDQITTEHIREIGNMMGFSMTVREFLSDMSSASRDPVAPMVVLNKGKPAIQSFALFHKNKMQFETNNNEMRGIFWLKRHSLKGKSITLQLEQGNMISFRITGQKFKIKAFVKGEIPEYRIKVNGRGIIQEGKQFLNLNDARFVHQIENEIEMQIKEDIEAILKKNRKYRIDTFRFGDYARIYNNLRWEKKWKEEWDDILPDIKTNIDVKFVLEQTGQNMNSAGNKNNE